MALYLSVLFSVLAAPPVSGEVVHETRVFRAADAMDYDWFGSDVAVGDGIIAIGAPGHSGAFGSRGLPNNGAVYAFDLATGEFRYAYTPEDTWVLSYFGSQLHIENGHLFASAPGDMTNGFSSGAVYVFDAFNGELVRKIVAPDGAAYEYFGWSIDAHDGRVLVGAPSEGANDSGLKPTTPGAAYVFDYLTGELVTKITLDDSELFDEFGRFVSLNDDVAVIGRTTFHRPDIRNQLAHVFDAETGQHLRTLFADGDPLLERRPHAVDIDADHAVVGAVFAENADRPLGAAYVFDVETGELLRTLTRAAADDAEEFGLSVAVSEERVLVGAASFEKIDRVYTYLFDINSGRELARLTPEIPMMHDVFGAWVNLSGAHAVVGAFADSVNGPSAGAAYVFDLSALPSPADLDGDGCVGSSDLAVLVAAWGSAGVADLDGSGVVGDGDVAVLFSAWGCE